MNKIFDILPQWYYSMNKLIINKGTNAGGANTNYNGKKFEEKTNNQQRLLDMAVKNMKH